MRCCRSAAALAASAVAVAAATAFAGGDDAPADPAPRATLYAFFATWCVPCRVELPHIQRLHATYASRGLRVVLVSEDAPSTAQNVPAFLARYGVTAPWVVDDESDLLARYNPTGSVPFTVVVDGGGRVVYAHAGYEPGDEALVDAAVADLLAGAADRAARRTRAIYGSSQSLGVWRKSRFEQAGADARLVAGIGRVEVGGRASRVSATARVDGALVDDAAADDGRATDARLERVAVAYDFGPVRLLAGDDYVAFGHGVSLSLRKVDPLGVDTSLRGARVDARGGPVRATAIAGRANPQNLDPIDLRVVDDVRDAIGGAEVAVDVGPATIAPYGLYVLARDASPFLEDPDDPASSRGEMDWTIGGVSADLRRGGVQVAAEVAAGRRRTELAAGARQRVTAWAAYAAAQWSVGRTTALVDAKAYRHWDIGRDQMGVALAYNEAPTLEREDQEVPNNADAIGARARLEVRLPHAVTAFANALAYRYAEDGADPVDRDLAVHAYAGVDRQFSGGASASVAAGIRRERAMNLATDRLERKLSLWHVDVDAAVPLAARWAATFKWNHRSEDRRSGLAFVRGLAVAGLAWRGVGTLSALYGYSTEDARTPAHYPAAELLVHLSRGGQARLFAGRLTGGRVCVSGTCRDVPPFEGVRVDVVVNW